MACICLLAARAETGATATNNLALVTSANSALIDVTLAYLTRLCKGTYKTWPDGKAFTLVMKDPEAPEMRVAVQQLFGAAPGEAKAIIAKLNQARPVVRIVDSDEEILRIVAATPGAVGLVGVYSINSTVKVLRVEGKLPFDAGYVLKEN